MLRFPSEEALNEFLSKSNARLCRPLAGERMKVESYSELSGVCTHPDFRGQGLAGVLSRAVVSRILARGEQAFLHAYAGHTATIAFYESLGFSVRARMTYTVLA